MDKMNNDLIVGLLIASFAFAAVLIALTVMSIVRYFRRRFSRKGVAAKNRYRSFRTKLWYASLLLVAAVWCIRFAVGYYEIFHPEEGMEALSRGEEVFNSLVHTLQTFSLDEDYAKYIRVGKEMAEAVWPGIVDFYGAYAAVLNFLVPLAGGAVIFELISEFSPGLRLTMATWMFWRKKYYFSELNDNSLALAKDIITNGEKNVAVVFTDAYADDADESGAERLARAKSMGAICIKDDLLHIRLRSGEPKIFMIDASENANLQTLTSLIEKDDKKVAKSEIYVFSSDNAYSQLDEEVSHIVDKRNSAAAPSRKKKRAAKLPVIIPVNGVRNMAVNLLADVPLYEPIIDKPADGDGKKTVNVAILGSGTIGTEIFLTSYWCGQMLDCSLRITVVSKEKRNSESDFEGEGDFEGRINNISPDILKTARPGEDILKYNNKCDRSEPYFIYDYIESDVLSDDFSALIKGKKLLETDYFIVALGSDEENFTVANRLRHIIGEHHIFSESRNKTVISYVVYNSDLAKTLNEDSKYRYVPDSGGYDVFMHAFGFLESVYSMKNVFLNDIADSAYDVGEAYGRKNGGEEPEDKKSKKKKEKERRFKGIYSYQANLAKVFHRRYKEYSAGFHKSSLFSVEKKDEEGKCFKKPEDDFLEFVVCKKKNEEDIAMLHRLAWLEHRRWCAYMRVKGFRSLNNHGDFRVYYGEELSGHPLNDHKYVSLKLHPCLVESCEDGVIGADFDEYGFIKKTALDPDSPEKAVAEYKPKDYLDEISLMRFKLEYEAYLKKCEACSGDKPDFDPSVDFKVNDYPEKGLSKEERIQYKKKRA